MTLFNQLNEKTRTLLTEAIDDKDAGNAVIELQNKVDVFELSLRTCNKIVAYSGRDLDEHFMASLRNEFKNI